MIIVKTTTETHGKRTLVIAESFDGDKSIAVVAADGSLIAGQDFPVGGIATPFYEQQLAFFRAEAAEGWAYADRA